MQPKDNKIKVAFDLDGVIIDKPPLISKRLLEKLFRGRSKGSHLHYRYPKSRLEIMIRKVSHFYLFRPPIKANIDFIKQLADNPRYELYVVSGRYSFLEKETRIWLKKRGLADLFKEIYLNTQDIQPHIFKEKTLKKLKPLFFVDDDYLLADYLTDSGTPGKIMCLPGKNSERCKKAISVNKLSMELVVT